MKKVYNVDLINNFLWENKLTKKEFCKMCKISSSSLSKILNNELNIGIIVLFKIARVMNLEIKDFFKVEV